MSAWQESTTPVHLEGPYRDSRFRRLLWAFKKRNAAWAQVQKHAKQRKLSNKAQTRPWSAAAKKNGCRDLKSSLAIPAKRYNTKEDVTQCWQHELHLAWPWGPPWTSKRLVKWMTALASNHRFLVTRRLGQKLPLPPFKTNRSGRQNSYTLAVGPCRHVETYVPTSYIIVDLFLTLPALSFREKNRSFKPWGISGSSWQSWKDREESRSMPCWADNWWANLTVCRNLPCRDVAWKGEQSESQVTTCCRQFQHLLANNDLLRRKYNKDMNLHLCTLIVYLHSGQSLQGCAHFEVGNSCSKCCHFNMQLGAWYWYSVTFISRAA